MVEQGNKANWPNQSDYVEPTRKGYLFNGWDYDWKNKVITEDTDIHPVWDKYTVIADANRTLISGEGDNNTDPTKMFYYLRTDSGKVIPDDVTFEKVALSSDELEIQFTDNGTAKEDNKGDNIWSGYEGALVNWKDILAVKDYVTDGITTLYLDIYANWYGSRMNGNLSITFNTYKGDDGMKKEGFVFKPTGNTTLVSTKSINNLNVYAAYSLNAHQPLDKMKKVYSKVATVEYDIRSRSALLIGNYTKSGRQLEYYSTVDGHEIYYSHDYSLAKFDKNAHTGQVKIGKVKQILNGSTTYLNWDVNTAKYYKRYHYGATEDSLTVQLKSDGNGGLILEYSIPPNNGTTGIDRKVEVHISMPYDNELYYTPDVVINFYQTES